MPPTRTPTESARAGPTLAEAFTPSGRPGRGGRLVRAIAGGGAVVFVLLSGAHLVWALFLLMEGPLRAAEARNALTDIGQPVVSVGDVMRGMRDAEVVLFGARDEADRLTPAWGLAYFGWWGFALATIELLLLGVGAALGTAPRGRARTIGLTIVAGWGLVWALGVGRVGVMSGAWDVLGFWLALGVVGCLGAVVLLAMGPETDARRGRSGGGARATTGTARTTSAKVRPSSPAVRSQGRGPARR